MEDDEKKAVELLKAVFIKFKNTYFIEPKPFLLILINYFGSATYNLEDKVFNHKVCLQVYKELYEK